MLWIRWFFHLGHNESKPDSIFTAGMAVILFSTPPPSIGAACIYSVQGGLHGLLIFLRIPSLLCLLLFGSFLLTVEHFLPLGFLLIPGKVGQLIRQ